MRAVFGNLTLIAVPIPHDCVDGLWRVLAATGGPTSTKGFAMVFRCSRSARPPRSRYLGFTSGITSRSPNAKGPTEPLVASPSTETEESGPRLMLSKFASVRSAPLSVIELDELGERSHDLRGRLLRQVK